MKMKYKNVYNTKSRRMISVKKDDVRKEIILYVFDERSKGLIRCLVVKQEYLLKIMAN